MTNDSIRFWVDHLMHDLHAARANLERAKATSNPRFKAYWLNSAGHWRREAYMDLQVLRTGSSSAWDRQPLP